MSTSTRNNLIVGLPATGKTTFLAALWYLAELEDLETSLTVDLLGENDEHLNELKNDWLDCREVERSKHKSQLVVAMSLRDVDKDVVSTVYFPDLAGESFERQWIDRQCDVEYAEIASNADGLLLFIHPETVREPRRLEEIIDVLPAAGEDSEIKVTPRERERDPTATMLVDLVQNVLALRQKSSRLKIAVVISAWDLSKEFPGKPSPELWLKQRLPLLHQYLSSNAGHFETRVFGISAQGGDYSDEDTLATLRSKAPHERVEIIGLDGTDFDLTQIIKWLA